jgi:cytochrome c oxidase cbb3-type subunit III
MRSNKKTSLALLVAAGMLPGIVTAATQNPDEKAGSYNMVLISLVGLMLILLFVIGMLANTLRQLTFVVRDKMQKDKATAQGIIKAVLLLIALGMPTAQLLAAEADKVAAPEVKSISGIDVYDFYLIIGVLALEFLVIFALTIYTRVLLKVIANKPELVNEAGVIIKKSWFWDKFNAAATIEQEKDILLDHNYDGIQELDNSLPPWWKYGFYLTIIVGFIYIYRFHVSNSGLSQQEEYIAEMQQGEEEKTAYLAHSANNVDENTVQLLKDPASLAEGHELFVKNCAACHLADGGGTVGPNLTDEFWIHGGGVKEIFKSIKYGWQDKGMKSWKDDLSPKQIQLLTSFIRSLKGTHPAVPKAPQGDIYIEAGEKGIPDSTKNNSDTLAIKIAAINDKK